MDIFAKREAVLGALPIKYSTREAIFKLLLIATMIFHMIVLYCVHGLMIGLIGIGKLISHLACEALGGGSMLRTLRLISRVILGATQRSIGHTLLSLSLTNHISEHLIVFSLEQNVVDIRTIMLCLWTIVLASLSMSCGSAVH